MSTFVVQEVIRNSAPGLLRLFAAHRAARSPSSLTGIVGIVIERSVIRFLYGRPLETLLATWGCRSSCSRRSASIFGPTNREVGNPSWMSGSFQLGEITLTVNRLVDHRLRAGRLRLPARCHALHALRPADARRDPEPRMACAMGIRTARVDALTFGLGSGIAGIAGVALSQIDNVSPNLGQCYIIDSFMVVVFGGVGNLWGTLVGCHVARHRQQVPRALCRRRARQDPRARLHHPLHPEAAARPLRAQGQGGRSMITGAFFTQRRPARADHD